MRPLLEGDVLTSHNLSFTTHTLDDMAGDVVNDRVSEMDGYGYSYLFTLSFPVLCLSY